MITLRAFQTSDKPALVEYLNNTNVAKYLSARIPQPYTIDDADWWIETGSKIGFTRAIAYEDILIGSIAALPGEFERERSAEIGFWLAEPYWGKGLASSAVDIFSAYIFNHTKILRLHASVFSSNKESMRVLEKCGYKLEGIFEKALFKKGQFFNEHYYSKLSSQ